MVEADREGLGALDLALLDLDFCFMLLNYTWGGDIFEGWQQQRNKNQ